MIMGGDVPMIKKIQVSKAQPLTSQAQATHDHVTAAQQEEFPALRTCGCFPLYNIMHMFPAHILPTFSTASRTPGRSDSSQATSTSSLPIPHGKEFDVHESSSPAAGHRPGSWNNAAHDTGVFSMHAGDTPW